LQALTNLKVYHKGRTTKSYSRDPTISACKSAPGRSVSGLASVKYTTGSISGA
jgi:hypothetical protein